MKETLKDGIDKKKVNEYLKNAMKELSPESLGEPGEDLPRTLQSFYAFHGTIMKDGALKVKDKELTAMAVAMLVCTGECARFHAAQAARLGATREEILESISVGMLMGGGPGVLRAVELIRSLREIGI